MADRRYRAGDSVEDICRACKLDRMHTVVVADAEGRPIRVSCGYCDSEHNYRGGPASARAEPSASFGGQAHGEVGPKPRKGEGVPFPLVSDRERTSPPMSAEQAAGADLEILLRRIIREETGLTPVVPADKWRNGHLVLRPGTSGLQEKSWPIETFFHKIVMLRNRLRVLEQQINATDLPEDAKVKLQGYVTGCYGSLTSFNVLFAETDDQFRGSGPTRHLLVAKIRCRRSGPNEGMSRRFANRPMDTGNARASRRRLSRTVAARADVQDGRTRTRCARG
jgi:hypothetical protein